MSESSKITAVAQGQTILREGQTATQSYMIQKGVVALFRVENNRRVVLERLGPGNLIGELSLLTKEPFHATAEAQEDSELLPIDREKLKELIGQCPASMQRLFKEIIKRLRSLGKQVKDQPSANVFYSFCQAFHLLSRAPDSRFGKAPEAGKPWPASFPVSYRTLSISAKNLLAISQLEIDTMLRQLTKLGIISIEEVKETTYREDAFGERVKGQEKVTDRILTIKEPHQFLEVARNLSQELAQLKTPYTQGLEFIDIHEMANLVRSKPEIIYKKIGRGEIPDNLFFLPRGPVLVWAKEVGEDYFKRVKRTKLNLEELESIDDVIHVDDESLHDAFSKIGFHKLAMLYSVASEEAREKMERNMSRKIGQVVREEASNKDFSDTVVADVEDELYGLIRSIKGGKK